MQTQSLHNVNEISAILVRTPGKPGDLSSVLGHIAQTARDAFAADACVILAFNPITSRFMDSHVVGNLRVEKNLLHNKPRSDGVTQQIFREDLLLIEDLEAKPEYHNRFTREEDICAFVGLAMRTRHQQRPLGIIYLDFRQPRKFSSSDRESFRIFAVQASFLLQETWLAHNYEEVARIGQQVNQNLGRIEDLFLELQTYVDTVLDNSHTLLLAVYQPQTNILALHIREHGSSIFLNKSLQGVSQYIIETQQSLFIQHLSKEAGNLPFQVINITGTEVKKSYIFVPITLRGKSLGVLSIQHL